MPSQTNLVNGCIVCGTRHASPVYFFKRDVSTKVLTPLRLQIARLFIARRFPLRNNTLLRYPVPPCFGTDCAFLFGEGHDSLMGRSNPFGQKDSKRNVATSRGRIATGKSLSVLNVDGDH
jgi:hypothetical protein